MATLAIKSTSNAATSSSLAWMGIGCTPCTLPMMILRATLSRSTTLTSASMPSYPCKIPSLFPATCTTSLCSVATNCGWHRLRIIRILKYHSIVNYLSIPSTILKSNMLVIQESTKLFSVQVVCNSAPANK